MRPALNPQDSAKLKALGILGIFMVVIGHSPSYRDASAPSVRSTQYTIFEFLFSDAIPRIVVMVFFAVSGFLFYLGHDGSRATTLKKIKARARSVAFPYLLWSALSLLLYAGLQSLPQTTGWFTNPARRVVGRSASDLLQIWLLDPIDYPLWFLRDLFFMALVSPALTWLLKHAGIATVIVLGVLHACDVHVPSPVEGSRIVTSDCYFYFSLGGLFALKNLPMRGSDRQAAMLGVLAFLLAFLRAANRAYEWVPDLWLFKAVNFVGVPAVWLLYDRGLRWMERGFVARISGLAFFVFVAHEPLMTMLKKPLVRWLGAGDLRHFAELLLTLAGTLTIVLSLGAFLRARLPKLFAFLCGGRGPERA